MQRSRGSFAVIGAAAMLLFASSCGGDGVSTPTAHPQPSEAGAGCSKADVRERVRAFVEALRVPLPSQLREVWGDRMKWFSVTKTRDDRRVWHFVAYQRRKAMRWVEEQGGLPIELRSVGGGIDRPQEQGHIGFRYTGRWHDKWVIGKGDMLCGSSQIRVWSMAIRDRLP